MGYIVPLKEPEACYECPFMRRSDAPYGLMYCSAMEQYLFDLAIGTVSLEDELSYRSPKCPIKPLAE